MRYKLFGRSGLRVSELSLGTATFGLDARVFGSDEEWGGGPQESNKILEAFSSAGGNFIDMAEVYPNSRIETVVGEFIKADRDRFVLSTKYTQSHGSDVSKAGNSRKNMRRSIEESLRQLNTDYVDILWLHNWDFSTPIDEILRGLDDLVSSGKVTYVGASNVEAWRISSANVLADLRGWAPFIGIQVYYNLADRTAERDLLPMARELDLGITAYAPLANGALTGKFNAGASKTGTRLASFNIAQRTLEIAGQVTQVAQEIERSPGQVALAWMRQQRRFVNSVIPIIGARNVSQIRENLGCLEVTLDAQQIRRLDEASVIDMGQPHDFLKDPFVRGISYAGQFDLVDNHRA